MKARKTYILITLLLMVMAGTYPLHGQVPEGDVEKLSEKIKSIEKVEQLYSIRYSISKYAKRTDLTLKQQAALNIAMKQLSEAFKANNHFRNAADVYKEYLDYNSKYLTLYNVFAKDSLVAFHKGIADKETAKIRLLDTEISGLQSSRAAVSGLKNRYYTLGGIAAAAAIAISLIIGYSKSRSIKQAEAQIGVNREQLMQFHRKSSVAGMVQGSIGYCREAANINSDAIAKIIESIEQEEGTKLFEKELAELRKAESEFNHLLS